MTSSGETPSSPVGCGRVKEFLCTEWAIGQVFVASNCVWMSIFCSFISLIFWVIAFGTVGWGRADNASVKRELGLWLECHTGAYTGCSYLSPSDISGELSQQTPMLVQSWAIATTLGSTLSRRHHNVLKSRHPLCAQIFFIIFFLQF